MIVGNGLLKILLLVYTVLLAIEVLIGQSPSIFTEGKGDSLKATFYHILPHLANWAKNVSVTF